MPIWLYSVTPLRIEIKQGMMKHEASYVDLETGYRTLCCPLDQVTKTCKMRFDTAKHIDESVEKCR